MSIGVGVPVFTKDAMAYCIAVWRDVTIEQIGELFGLDYSDLEERVNLGDLRIADVSALHPDAAPDWTRHIVSWSASLNAYDHEIRMIYYDVIVESPLGDVLTRQYQVRSEEVIA